MMGVRLIGRDAANHLAGPVYDYVARRRSKQYLASLRQVDLSVHLGCGYRHLDGWVNLDMIRNPSVDVVWNLRRGLPFEDGSCAFIFSEHIVEHVAKPDAMAICSELLHVLKPGGVVRLSTPDAGRYLQAYVHNRDFLRHPAFQRLAKTPMDRINMMMRQDGQHLWVYDAESLSALQKKEGFAQVVVQDYRVSMHEEMNGLDDHGHAFESLYVGAIK